MLGWKSNENDFHDEEKKAFSARIGKCPRLEIKPMNFMLSKDTEWIVIW